MGGTSGALYSLLFEGASKSAPQWADAWQSALDLATTYSKARIGNRTMVSQISCVDMGDGYIPPIEFLTSIVQNYILTSIIVHLYYCQQCLKNIN